MFCSTLCHVWLLKECSLCTVLSVPSTHLPYHWNRSWCLHIWNKNITRMHSSRMRTVCCSGCLSRGGGAASVHAGIPAPRDKAHPLKPGIPPWDQSPLEPGLHLEQTSPREQTPLRDQASPPPGQSHTCKNITLATSLRTVINNRYIDISVLKLTQFKLQYSGEYLNPEVRNLVEFSLLLSNWLN